MPKTKKPQSDSESDSDSGPDDREPTAKKSKSGGNKNADGEYEWQLDSKRTLKVREFKGKVFVDIREYYEKDGKLLPGKKGISLSVAQWKKLTDIVKEVDDAVKEVA